LAQEAIPLPAATKKNEGERYQVLIDVVNKLTVQFYHDAASLRLLDTVADAGALEEPDDVGQDVTGEDEP
jgi:hypothetical protein